MEGDATATPRNASKALGNVMVAPSDNTGTPSDNTGTPRDASKALGNVMVAPSDTTATPRDASKALGNVTVAPSDTTATPSDASKALGNVMVAPSDTTATPSDASKALGNVMVAPSDTTATPSDASKAVGNVTVAPSDTTATPRDASKALGNATVTPSDLGAALGNATVAPSSPMVTPSERPTPPPSHPVLQPGFVGPRAAPAPQGWTMSEIYSEVAGDEPPSDSFWMPNRYQRTVRRLEEGSQVCDQLVGCFRDRARIEGSYARHMGAWVQKWRPLVDASPLYGSVRRALAGLPGLHGAAEPAAPGHAAGAGGRGACPRAGLAAGQLPPQAAGQVPRGPRAGERPSGAPRNPGPAACT
ncbi:unnamed protein product, partial [Lepidochelys kempii]